MKDFFISYNKADRAWAEWIAWVLEEAGYKVVIQAWDFRPGSNFVLEMNQALKEAERVLAVLSPDFIASHFTAPEWAAAFARDPTGKDRKFVPVRVRETDLSGLLGQINYIDLVGSNDEAVTRKRLLGGVKLGRGKPDEKPAFPGAPERTIKIQPRFPGSLPPIWNVPHNRNRNFTGRDDLLATLRSQLLAGHHSALTALHGLGGIGKTQTAVEYAYRYAGEYDLVWWIRSEDPTTLAGDYTLLASKLELPEAVADQQAAVQAVKDRLSATNGWLLVFDNARGPEDIRPYLPAGSGGHVIITSRSPDWRSVADPLSVGILNSEDAVDFLHRRSGKRDEGASRQLVEELGWLPLAIEQAAAYIDEHAKSIPDYLELFRRHRQKILSRGRPSLDYPATLETTWELSFAEVRSQSPAGADLLSLCAFLAPDDIPLDVIIDGKDRLPELLASVAGDELEFDEAVLALRKHSLIERTGNAVSVHRLVQAMVRERMEKSDKRVWAESAAGVLSDVFPYDSDDVNTWPTCIRLLAHATAVAAHCEAEKTGLGSADYLLSQSALYLQARGDLSAARSLNERALTIAEAQYGPDHPEVITSLNNLGVVLKALGELGEARKYYERALKINEARNGPDHPSSTTIISNLGRVLQDLGELSGAQELLERALRIDEGVYGLEHPKIAIRINNLGSVMKELRNLVQAQKLFTRSLQIYEAAYGPDHPYVATPINNLGTVLKDTGMFTEARKLHERALRISEASYGPDHPDVATDLNNLSVVLRALGELDEARMHSERALKILETIFGPDHPSTRLVRKNLDVLNASNQ